MSIALAIGKKTLAVISSRNKRHIIKISLSVNILSDDICRLWQNISIHLGNADEIYAKLLLCLEQWFYNWCHFSSVTTLLNCKIFPSGALEIIYFMTKNFGIRQSIFSAECMLTWRQLQICINRHSDNPSIIHIFHTFSPWKTKWFVFVYFIASMPAFFDNIHNLLCML